MEIKQAQPMNAQQVQPAGALNLYQKISKVMATIQYLQKDGQVSFGQTKYAYLSEEKITTEIRTACIQFGLVIFPVEVASEKVGNITSTIMKYKIVDIATGDFQVLAAVGHGADSQDKGASKSMTAAFKYMQKQTFMIPSGNDPDKVSSAELDQDPTLMPIAQAQIQQITTLKGALKMDTPALQEIATKTCGTADISKFTMAMATKLINAMNSQSRPA